MQLGSKFFPLRFELPPTLDNPAHMLGLVRSADISPRVAHASQDSDRAGGAFEPGSFAGILRFCFFANSLDQLRRYPAARWLAIRHLFICFQAEDVDIALPRHLDPVISQIAAQLSEFLRIESELRYRVISASREFLFKLQVLVCAIRLRVLERRDRHGNP